MSMPLSIWMIISMNPWLCKIYEKYLNKYSCNASVSGCIINGNKLSKNEKQRLYNNDIIKFGNCKSPKVYHNLFI